MTDPDVTLTDYGLALLCAWLVWRIWRGRGFGATQFWLILFFGAAGVAPLLGGTVHGFFDLEGTTGHDVLWPAMLITIGVAALAAWGLGARLILKDGAASSLIGVATVVFFGTRQKTACAAKAFGIRVSRMSTHGNAVRYRDARGRGHRFSIARVTSAGDIAA